MKPKLFFGLSLGFDVTTNEQLKQMSVLKFWDRGLQKNLYIFNVNDLDKVIALTGKEIDFEEQKVDILNLMQHSPSLKKEINTKRWKGEGFIQVTRFPKIFIVKTIIRKEPQTFKIPIETVQSMWNVIRDIEKGKHTKTRDIAEKQIKALGITRYHKDTGYFRFNALFGTRHDYFNYIYYPIKVLQHYGVIDYNKSGFITRIEDKWDIQGEIFP